MLAFILLLAFLHMVEPLLSSLILGSIIVNFFLGKILDKRLAFYKPVLITGIIFNLGILLFYKYLFLKLEDNAMVLLKLGFRLGLPSIMV